MDEHTEAQIKLINLAKKIAQERGQKFLSLSDFRAETNISEYTIAREFGGWLDLCRFADLEVPNRHEEASDDELLNEMKRVFETAGKRVNSARFDALSKFGSKRYSRRFGSWNNAIAQLESQRTNHKVSQLIGCTDENPMNHKTFPRAASMVISMDSAQCVLRAAIDLLKAYPESFQTEFAEIKTLVLEIEKNTDLLATLSTKTLLVNKLNQHDLTSSLADVARWLENRNSVSISEFRARLLPLDFLPSAAIDAINELALDICGETAVEEIGDNILVKYKIIIQVNHAFVIDNDKEKPSLRSTGFWTD